jgi:hypothetical protein
MCDYSLYVFQNRLARDGEELVARIDSRRGALDLSALRTYRSQRTVRLGWAKTGLNSKPGSSLANMTDRRLSAFRLALN